MKHCCPLCPHTNAATPHWLYMASRHAVGSQRLYKHWGAIAAMQWCNMQWNSACLFVLYLCVLRVDDVQPMALHYEALIFYWMELLHFVENCICSFATLDSRVYSTYFECFVGTVIVGPFEVLLIKTHLTDNFHQRVNITFVICSRSCCFFFHLHVMFV